MSRLVFILTALALISGCGDEAEPPVPLPEPPNDRCVGSAGPDDPDDDDDGAKDECDNCVDVPNPQQDDADHDGLGDACDDDDDNDGLFDGDDPCPKTHQPDGVADSDGDGLADACDSCPDGSDLTDLDGDGVNGCVDTCPMEADASNLDSDGDGVGDVCDNCPQTPNAGQADVDGDGRGDPCDGDGGFTVVEASFADIQAAIVAGETTCEEVTTRYLERTLRYDLDLGRGAPLNAYIALSERAVEQARALDRSFDATGELVGPLHCAVIAIKTNYGSPELTTTSGSFALEGLIYGRDGWALAGLRQQGAILLGATAMDEFAAGIHGIGGRSGKTGNAYNTSFNSGGSSAGSGVAVGANLAGGALGTDNCASLTIPSSYNGLVTFRSSLGLVSTDGIYPSGQLDAVSGPLAKSVTDMALMLDAMASLNPDDPLQDGIGWERPTTYVDYLRTDGLEGKRIGVLRELSAETSGSYRYPFEGGNAEVQMIWQRAFSDMERLGATVVDNVILPDFAERRYGGGTELRVDTFIKEAQTSSLGGALDICGTRRYSSHIYASEAVCREQISWGLAHPAGSLEAGRAAYRNNRTQVEAVMDALELDAIVFPVDAYGTSATTRSKANCIETSVTGLPALTVVAGMTRTNSPSLPVGLMILGRMFDEGPLIEIAYAYEQGTRHRAPPTGLATVDREDVSGVTVDDFNALHREIAWATFEQVLRDGGKFDLTAPGFRDIANEVIASDASGKFDYLLP